jgi:NitT/TauT family transport system substrate-binding protein
MSRTIAPAGTAVVALALLLAGCAPAAQPSTAPAPTAATAARSPGADAPAGPAKPAQPPKPESRELKTVKVITVGSPSDAGLLIGNARGYFQQEGLEIDFDRLSGGAQTVPLLATGQIQVAGASPSAGFFNAIRQGANVKIVADKGQTSDGWRGVQWVVRKDLWDSGQLRDVGDLPSKIVGINLPHTGGVTDLQLRDLLQAARIGESELGDLVTLSYPDQVQALANRAVDLVLMLEPGLSVAVKRGLGVRWDDSPEKGKVRQVAVLMYSPQFAESEEGRRFAVAYLRGVRDFYDAMVNNKDRAEIIRIMTEESTVKDREVFEEGTSLFYLDPNGAVNWEGVQAYIDTGRQMGLIPEPPDLARARDDSVLQYAIQQLGRYETRR